MTCPLPAEPPSEPAQACCDLHRDTGKDDAPCLWKLPDGSITSIPPAPSEPAKAPLSTMVTVNRQLWEQTRERALKVSDLGARLSLEQQARVDALKLSASWEKRAEAAEKERGGAVAMEGTRVNGWWRWYFQGEWTGAKADQRDEGIASGAPAPKGTP